MKSLKKWLRYNPVNLIYRYRSCTANTKIDKFDNVFILLDKIREGGRRT